MEKDKLEDIETIRNSRIAFTHKGEEYNINVTNDNELRLSVIHGTLIIVPQACNSITFEASK